MFMPGFCFCMWEFFQWSQSGTASNTAVTNYVFPHTGFGPGGTF